jgi:hypothetical protein
MVLESNAVGYKEIFKTARKVSVASRMLSEFIWELETIKEQERTGKKTNTFYNAYNIYFRRRL